MNEIIQRFFTSFFLIGCLYIAYINEIFFIVVLLTILILSIFEYSKLIDKIKLKKTKKIIYNISGYFYIIIVFVFLIYQFNDIKNIIFYFILICITTDIGGLIIGKIFKGKKLTKVSPNKTYSGFYGSFLMSFIVMFVCYNNLNLNFVIILLFTFSVCLLSQFGDLFFSFIKRKAKVKDTGKLLPGHGGILDRVDGMIMSVPINVLIYTLTL